MLAIYESTAQGAQAPFISSIVCSLCLRASAGRLHSSSTRRSAASRRSCRGPFSSAAHPAPLLPTAPPLPLTPLLCQCPRLPMSAVCYVRTSHRAGDSCCSFRKAAASAVPVYPASGPPAFGVSRRRPASGDAPEHAGETPPRRTLCIVGPPKTQTQAARNAPTSLARGCGPR